LLRHSVRILTENLYPVYAIEQTSSERQANVQQTSSKHRSGLSS